MIASAGLIVDDGDQASGTRTERVLSSGIGDSACRQRLDVGRRTIRATLDLVEWSVVGVVQSSSGGVGSDTVAVDVARSSTDK